MPRRRAFAGLVACAWLLAPRRASADPASRTCRSVEVALPLGIGVLGPVTLIAESESESESAPESAPAPESESVSVSGALARLVACAWLRDAEAVRRPHGAA